MINWKDLNLNLPASLSVDNKSPAVRKVMENGRTFQRQRYEKPYEEGKLSFNFLGVDFQIFKGVWIHYLNNGTEWFLIELPVGGQDLMTECQVRFISDYSYKYISPYNVTVSARIEFYKVEAPDLLALGNLIQVGDSVLYPDELVWDVTFNNQTLQSTAYMTGISQVPDVNEVLAVQWWDGSLQLAGTRTKLMPATNLPSDFRVQFWRATSSTNAAVKNPPMNRVSFATGASKLKYFDPYQHPEFKSWATLDFVNCSNWQPTKVDTSTFRLEIDYAGTETMRFSNIPWMVDLIINFSDAGFLDSNGIDISTMPNIESITFTHDTPATIVEVKRIVFRVMSFDNRNSGHLDYGNVWVRALQLGSTTENVQFELTDNTLLTELTLYQINDRATITLDNNPYLSTLNILQPSILNFLDIRDCNFSVSDLKNFIDDITAYVGTGAYGQIHVENNPCWVGGQLDPADPDTAYVLNAASNAGFTFAAT